MLTRIQQDTHETKVNVAVLQTQMKSLVDADLPNRMTKAESVTGVAVWMAGTIVTALLTGVGWVASKLGII